MTRDQLDRLIEESRDSSREVSAEIVPAHALECPKCFRTTWWCECDSLTIKVNRH